MTLVSRSLRPVTPVGILAQRLGVLADQVRAGEAPASLGAELAELASLAGGLEPYVDACTSAETPALTALAERTRGQDWTAIGDSSALEAEMLSGHAEGVFLKFLVAISRARRVLEVGMFTGYSALAMAEALGPHGHVVACELDPEVAAFARHGFTRSNRHAPIEVRVGPAAETLRRLGEDRERFDLIFIDADKGGYLGYLEQILDEDLLATGGTICVDNTLLQGEPWAQDPGANGAAIRNFNATLAGDDRLEQVLLPLRDGITLIRRV
jgi:caffeoyl-CoA O-methyltransferase